jgi:hypothetical protein
MLGGLEDQAESVMQPREACRCAAVGKTRQGEVRRRVVVTIVINRYSQEVSSSLTAHQRGSPVVANTAGVAASGKNSRYFHTLGYENIFLQKSDFFHTQKRLFHTLKNNFIPSKK